MRALQQDAPGGPLTCRDVPVPQPSANQVLVRMAAAPINPSDLGTLKGHSYGDPQIYPLIPGLEGSGQVVAAGSGMLARFLMGKRVACSAVQGDGTWAEYAVALASACIPLNKGADLEQSAMLIVNPLTAMAIFEIARAERHPAIISTAAASALGGMLLRLAKRFDIPMIHIVRREAQIDVVRRRGGEHILNSSSADFDEQLAALALKLNATLILDAIAGPMTGRLVEAAPYGSKILLYSRLSGQDSQFNAHSAFSKQLHIAGWLLPNWQRSKSMLQTLRLANRTQALLKDELRSPVHRRVTLESADAALAGYAENMTAGKVMLVANPDLIPLSEHE